ncbi:MAG: hypothetical protein ACLS3M_06955 [Collinsella sp.]
MTDIVHVENLVKRYDDLMRLTTNLSIAPADRAACWAPTARARPRPSAASCSCLPTTRDHRAVRRPMTPALYDLKRRIGVVPQQVAVGELTVRENIIL